MYDMLFAMATKQTILSVTPAGLLAKLPKYNFAFLAAFAVYIIIFDGGNVLTREAIYHRWMFVAVLLIVFSLFWMATKKATSRNLIIGALLLCVLAELALAGFTTYWERGMASMSTVLYIVPIASMALSRSRTYTVGTALLASAAYTFASTKYFYDRFNEGYRVQLYGEIFFYSVVFLVVGWIIAMIAHESKK